MNSSFQRIKTDSLPLPLIHALDGKKILKSFHSSTQNRYIIWVVNKKNKHHQELEFDALAMRFLDQNERAKALASPYYIDYKDLNVKVLVSYSLEAGTDVLHEELTVYDAITKLLIVQAKYVVFNAFRPDKKKK